MITASEARLPPIGGAHEEDATSIVAERWRSATSREREGPAPEVDSDSTPETASEAPVQPEPSPAPSAPARRPMPPPAAAGGMAARNIVDPNGPRIRPSWAAELLETEGDWRALARRGATGALLAAGYGLALGAREGGSALLVHALGVPAALVAVSLLGLPALYIVLALFDAPLSPRKAAGAAVRGIASGGLALAGLAPLAALYVVTSSTAGAAAIAGGLGLALGGLLGLRHLTATLREALDGADSATRFMAGLSQVGFGLFAVLLAWRVWSALLPLLGGVS